MTAISQTPAQENRPPSKGPGADLRAARESKKLSQAEVASALRLEMHQIKALESDEYARLPAPIFVRGYVRAYARLLELPPEPLVSSYDRLEVAAAPPVVARVSRIKGPSRAPGGMWLVFVLGFVLIGLGYVLWGQRATTPQVTGQATVAEPAASGEGQVPETRSFPSPGEGDEVLPETPSQSAADGTPSVERVAPVVIDPPPAVAAAPPSEDEPPAASDEKRATVSLEFSAESWVEIEDATGRRMLFGLMRPGDTRSFEGVPPFSVLFGYSPGVSVKYNGRPIDHSRYSREDVARFKLGDAQVRD